MLAVDNQTPFPCLAFEKHGRRGEVFDVVVLRGCFALQPNTVVTPCEPALPVLADRYRAPWEPPGYGEAGSRSAAQTPSLLEETDLVAFKPATDITLIGTARAPGHQPTARWPAGLRIGQRLCKALWVSGPRLWLRRWLGGWWLSQPYPVAEAPLAYELAYGGSYAAPTRDAPQASVVHPDNPIGLGLISRQRLGQLRRDRPLLAPQFEAPQDPVRRPNASHAGVGFGPLCRWWPARLPLAGTAPGRAAPELPPDFDYRFYNAAPQDQQVAGYLAGHEALTLWGLLPEGRYTTMLPGLVLQAELNHRPGAPGSLALRLDTLSVDTDTRTLALVWRLTLPAGTGVRQATLHLDAPRGRPGVPFAPPAPGRG